MLILLTWEHWTGMENKESIKLKNIKDGFQCIFCITDILIGHSRLSWSNQGFIMHLRLILFMYNFNVYLKILLLFILTTNGFLPGGRGTTITHNTYHTKLCWNIKSVNSLFTWYYGLSPHTLKTFKINVFDVIIQHKSAYFFRTCPEIKLQIGDALFLDLKVWRMTRYIWKRTVRLYYDSSVSLFMIKRGC
jgi:hypothetical protein